MGNSSSSAAAWNALQSELGMTDPIPLEALCSFQLLLLGQVTLGKEFYVSMAFNGLKALKKKRKKRFIRKGILQ